MRGVRKMDLRKYSKAFVPVLVGAALYVLNYLGVTSEMSVKESLTLVASSILVYFVPNRK